MLQGVGSEKKALDTEVILLDDTPDIRTVIVQFEASGGGDVMRYQVNLNWSISKLTDFLKEEYVGKHLNMDLSNDYRLRNLKINKIFNIEE